MGAWSALAIDGPRGSAARTPDSITSPREVPLRGDGPERVAASGRGDGLPGLGWGSFAHSGFSGPDPLQTSPLAIAADPGPSGSLILGRDLIAKQLSENLLFSQEDLDLYLISGEQFARFADPVGRLRELTYRLKLSGSGSSHDLDSRDPHYDHFLLIHRDRGELAGAARLQFVPRTSSPPTLDPDGGERSYLEHVYPGIKAQLAHLGNHLEIGRVVLAPPFQKQPHSLMCLFRGGLQVAMSSGYQSIHGLVSYNQFAHLEAVNHCFLSTLLQPPFLDQSAAIPVARHPVTDLKRQQALPGISSIQELEHRIRRQLDPEFRLPALLRHYINLMEARVQNLSLARDFNQITEILMATDLNRIPQQRLDHFINIPHRPVYRQFGWFRGADQPV